MEITFTKQAMKDLVDRSEKLKRGFVGLVLLTPQIILEDDLHELQELARDLAANFDTCASFLGEFGRMGASSKKFAPTKKKK